VPHVAVPTREQVRAVLRESHPLWGAGLTLAAYVEMWEELARSRWGRTSYGWRALVDDDGRVLSSLKLYRPQLRIGGRTHRSRALGAVFTPRPLRGNGFAAALIRAVLAEEPGARDEPAFLFTDIGVAYYESFGFAALPCEDAVGTLPAAEAAASRGVRLRTMTSADLDEVGRAHERCASSRSIAIVRDRPHWEFLLLRAEAFFRRIDGSGLDNRFMIAETGRRPLGYLVGVLGPGEWNLREAAAFDDDPDTLARILSAAGTDAAAQGARTVWGWIPRSWWPLVPAWRLRLQPRLRAIPMLRAPDGAPIPDALETTEGAFISYLDQF
jgi:hypothetical protein